MILTEDQAPANTRDNHYRHRVLLFLGICISSALWLLLCRPCGATDPIERSLPDFSDAPHRSGIITRKVDDGFRVKGWELTDQVYFGQARIGGKSGVGIMVDRGRYVYGVNNRGLSFMLRF